MAFMCLPRAKCADGESAWSRRRVGRARCAPKCAIICILMASALSGCTLAPRSAEQERDRVSEAGRVYERAIEERVLVELPPEPTWKDVLQRAFLANGELEASYFQWKAAVERIDIASAYPNSNVMFGYSYMFSSERMKSYNRQTFSVGIDPSMNLAFPTKVQQMGHVALDDAKAAGQRFRAVKFELQRKVISALAELWMLEEQLEIEQEQFALARLVIDAIRARSVSGGIQQEMLRAEANVSKIENMVENIRARLGAMRAMLNGMIARDPDAPLMLRDLEPRVVPESDAEILAAGVELNPEIAELAHQVRGRSDALELARMQWIPDINPSVMWTGNVSQVVSAMIMLPTTIPQIRGSIREAEAMLRADEAMLHQTQHDRAALLVATLIGLRNEERQVRLIENTLLPLAERVVTNARQTYATGSGMYLDLLEAQGMVLETKLFLVEMRSAREKRLAELEALLGVDIETLTVEKVEEAGKEHTGSDSEAGLMTPPSGGRP